GSWEKLLMRLSVKPSLKYSAFAALLALANGSTASESMGLPRWSQAGTPNIRRDATTATPMRREIGRRRERLFGGPGRGEIDSVSTTFRANARSRADSNRLSGYFDRHRRITRLK